MEWLERVGGQLPCGGEAVSDRRRLVGVGLSREPAQRVDVGELHFTVTVQVSVPRSSEATLERVRWHAYRNPIRAGDLREGL